MAETKSPEVNTIRLVIKDKEQKIRGPRVRDEELIKLYGDIESLYSAFYGKFPRKVPVILLPPDESSRRYLSDTHDMNIPRGKHMQHVHLSLNPSRTEITGAVNIPGQERVFIVKGDTKLIDSVRPLGVFRAIMGHEFMHTQVVIRPVVGVLPAPLEGNDLGLSDPIYYLNGFKAMSFDMKEGSLRSLTHRFNEWMIQYMTMSMFGNFESKDQILEKMKSRGLGVDSNTIIGAELINDIFTGLNIDPRVVEAAHSQSDITGLMGMLNSNREGLGMNILQASFQTDERSSITALMDIRNS